jgi:hypothetical protein
MLAVSSTPEHLDGCFSVIGPTGAAVDVRNRVHLTVSGGLQACECQLF